MKFDYVIGNPPYQDETLGDNKGFAPPVYNKFLDASYEIADKVEMIHPARFLFNAGSTPKDWNARMLKDEHFKILYYESESSKVFTNTAITGGVVISYRSNMQKYVPIIVFSPFPELNTIRQKIQLKDNHTNLGNIMSGRTPYLFTDDMHRENPNAEEVLSKGHKYDVSSNALSALPDVFEKDKPNDLSSYYRILGRMNNARAYCWVKKSYVRGRNPDYIGKWKVFLPKANGASGMLGEEAARLISKPAIGEPNDVATDTFLCVGAFNSKSEAEALLKYINGKFSRVLLGILKVTQDNSPDKWKYVPLQDFTAHSDIDWSKSVVEIDQQLYRKYDLTADEIEFIETHVKEMA